jgi:arsenate reductase
MQSSGEKLKILYLCTGNSCRSQMAESWPRYLKGDAIDAYSAGVEPHGVDPRAVKALGEVGIDISRQSSKHVDMLQGIEFDFVITLCDQANESGPFFPEKTRRLRMGFDDPPRLAANAPSEEKAMEHYRRIRDEIKRFVESLPKSLEEEQ